MCAGSLEAFPTGEQAGSARIVWGLISGMFFIIEGLLFWSVWRHGR